MRPVPSSLSVFTFDLSEFRRHRCRAHHRDELPMALHAVLGVAPFLFGNTIARGPSLAIRPRKPTSTGSLRPHVFNAVNNLPYQTSGKYTTSDFTGRVNDWRVAIAWVACRSPTLPSPATACPPPLTPLAFNLNRTSLTTTPAVHTHVPAPHHIPALPVRAKVTEIQGKFPLAWG